MKLCLPVTKNDGIKSSVSEHFGSAPYFIIVDTDTTECSVITNTNSNHSHGMCQPLSVLSNYQFDGIVVGGIGLGALNKLRASNIKVFKTEYTNIADTVEAYKANKLQEMTTEASCAHHDHDCGGIVL